MIVLCRIMMFIEAGSWQGMDNTSRRIKPFASVISMTNNFVFDLREIL